MSDDSDKANALTQAVTNYVSAALGSEDGANALDQGIRKWAKSADDFGGHALTDLEKDAKNAGVAFGGVAEAIATQSLPKLQQQLDAVNAQKEGIERLVDEQQNANDAGTKTTQNYDKQLTGLGHLQDALKKNVEQQKLQKEVLEEVAQQAGFSSVAAYKAYEAAVAEATTDQQNWNSAVAQSFSQAATASDDYIKSQAVNWGQEQANLNEVIDAYNKFPGAIAELTSEGLDAAGKAFAESNFTPAQIEQLMSLPADQRANIVSQWNQAGKDAKQGLKDGISAGDLDTTVTVKAKADTSGAKKDIKSVTDAQHDTTVTAKADTSKAEKELKDTTDRKRTATITAELDHRQFDKDMSSLLRTRSMTVTVNQVLGKKVNN
jgi:hypothetical protein